jgi:uncharacterized RDD family membrane protein YckC
LVSQQSEALKSDARLPIRRTLARLIDGIFALVLTLSAAGLLVPEWFTQFVPAAAITLFITFLLTHVAVETVLLWRYRTTLGKALTGLRVLRKDGQALSASMAMARSSWVLLAGCALWLLPFTLFTGILGFRRLAKHVAMRWDVSLGTEVVRDDTLRYDKRHWVAVALAVLLAVTAAVKIGVGIVDASLPNPRDEGGALQTLTGRWVWVNKITGRAVALDSQWRLSREGALFGGSEYVVRFLSSFGHEMELRYVRGAPATGNESWGNAQSTEFVQLASRLKEELQQAGFLLGVVDWPYVYYPAAYSGRGVSLSSVYGERIGSNKEIDAFVFGLTFTDRESGAWQIKFRIDGSYIEDALSDFHRHPSNFQVERIASTLSAPLVRGVGALVASISAAEQIATPVDRDGVLWQNPLTKQLASLPRAWQVNSEHHYQTTELSFAVLLTGDRGFVSFRGLRGPLPDSAAAATSFPYEFRRSPDGSIAGLRRAGEGWLQQYTDPEGSQREASLWPETSKRHWLLDIGVNPQATEDDLAQAREVGRRLVATLKRPRPD